jgi:beta-xylosidase
MGCLVGDVGQSVESFSPCEANPLFEAEHGYGPADVLGPEANDYFEYRTISSADVVRVGDHYYMTYEGVRGPSSYIVVDDQFGLGMARSVGLEIDGPWEKYPGNPIITDLPGNVGLGHADLVIVGDITYLYTATPEGTRGRYVLLER